MTRRKLLVTTSWDDGHPRDLRLAELLHKYGLKGTFYIPRTAERGTIGEEQIRQLSTEFEIGAHTMNHVELTTVPNEQAHREIAESKVWVESVVGKECSMFCFPRGKFTSDHLGYVRDSGYLAARTVELLSTKFPFSRDGVLEMPTTVQIHSHRNNAYIKNMLKRRIFKDLWKYILHGQGQDWPEVAQWIWDESAHEAGVFHIWGHSWEIEDHDQWARLEEMFRFLSEHASDEQYMTNTEVCQLVSQDGGAEEIPYRHALA